MAQLICTYMHPYSPHEAPSLHERNRYSRSEILEDLDKSSHDRSAQRTDIAQVFNCRYPCRLFSSLLPFPFFSRLPFIADLRFLHILYEDQTLAFFSSSFYLSISPFSLNKNVSMPVRVVSLVEMRSRACNHHFSRMRGN